MPRKPLRSIWPPQQQISPCCTPIYIRNERRVDRRRRSTTRIRSPSTHVTRLIYTRTTTASVSTAVSSSLRSPHAALCLVSAHRTRPFFLGRIATTSTHRTPHPHHRALMVNITASSALKKFAKYWIYLLKYVLYVFWCGCFCCVSRQAGRCSTTAQQTRTESHPRASFQRCISLCSLSLPMFNRRSHRAKIPQPHGSQPLLSSVGL
jgi:hypothetical protein